MIVEDLIKELQKLQNQKSEVLLQVSYTSHCCGPDQYCYCSSEEHNFICDSIATEQKTGKLNKDKYNKIYIRGERN